MPSVQVPPFWHGSGMHSSMSEKRTTWFCNQNFFNSWLYAVLVKCCIIFVSIFKIQNITCNANTTAANRCRPATRCNRRWTFTFPLPTISRLITIFSGRLSGTGIKGWSTFANPVYSITIFSCWHSCATSQGWSALANIVSSITIRSRVQSSTRSKRSRAFANVVGGITIGSSR